MSYDQFAEHRSRQAETQRRESQRFWDNQIKETWKTASPAPPMDGAEAVGGILGLILLLLTPVGWCVRMVIRDMAPPWNRFRKAVGLVAVIGVVAGWTAYAVLSNPDQGLAWVVAFLSGLLLTVVAVPRTILVLGVLIGALGAYVEFFAQ